MAVGLIVNGELKEKYWANSARALVAGLCAYVKTAPLGESDGVRGRTLVEVRRLLALPDGPPVRRMSKSEACGGIICAGAAQLSTAGPNEKGSILSTAIEQTDWISGQGAETVSASDFSLEALKLKRATMYFVVPSHRLAEYGKFLRLMVNESLRMAGRIGSAGLPLLFILDEFYTLGRLEAIAEAAANIRSYGVRLWPQVQGLGQLRELYQENWETFLPNLAVFGIGDLTTARYASEMLGHTIVMRKDRDGVQRPAGAALLRNPAEIAYEVEPAGGRMVVYRNGASPFLLRRLPYPKLFSKSQYNPDPDVAGS